MCKQALFQFLLVLLVTVPLFKASHMAKFRAQVGRGHEYRGAKNKWVYFCKQSTRVPATSMPPILPVFWVTFSFNLKVEWFKPSSHKPWGPHHFLFPASPRIPGVRACVYVREEVQESTDSSPQHSYINFLLSQNCWWIMVCTPPPVINCSSFPDFSFEVSNCRLLVNYGTGKVALRWSCLGAIMLAKESKLTSPITEQTASCDLWCDVLTWAWPHFRGIPAKNA